MKTGALRHYRDFSRRRLPVWLVGLVGAVWLAFEYVEWQDYPDPDACEITERVADVGLTLEAEFGDQATIVAWILGIDDEPGSPGWLREELERNEVADETDADELVEALAGADVPGAGLLVELVSSHRHPTEKEWRDLRTEFDGIAWWEWEADAFERIAGATPPAWVAERLEDRAETRNQIVRWTLVASGATLVVMLAGLVCLPRTLTAFARGPDCPRLMKLWPLGWLVFAFAAIDLVANWAYTYVWEAAGTLDATPLALDVLIDSAWRIGGAAGMLAMMLPRVGDAWRVFGFDRPLRIGPVLGMLALLLWFSSFWYRYALDWFPEDAGLYLDEDGWGGLLYAILSGVILAPICEELVFRGMLFGGLWGRLGFWPATLLSSFVFSAVHHYGPAGSVGIFVMGIGACVLFRRTGSLTGPILVHAAYNGLITLSVWPVYHAPFS